MGLIPVFVRPQSPKKKDAVLAEPRIAAGGSTTSKQGKEGKDRSVHGWARRRSKGEAVPQPSEASPSPTSPHPGALPAEAGALPPAPLAPPAMPHNAIASPPAVPQTAAPSPNVSVNQNTPPAPPRQVLPPRIPSVMYCPVLDKQGFGYGNEERRRADFL